MRHNVFLFRIVRDGVRGRDEARGCHRDVAMKLENVEICSVCGSCDIAVFDERSNICRCQSCRYVFHNPRPALDEVSRYYSRSEQCDPWLGESEARDILWMRRLRRVLKYKNHGTLLDVGTGIAQFLFFAKAHFDVEGTEISNSAIRIAKQRYDIDVTKGEIESIDWDYQFDVITLFHVLEHVPDPSSTIRRCRELLKSDGVLVVAVPNDLVGVRSRIRRLLSILKIGRFRHYGRLGLPKIDLDGSQDEIHLSHFTPSVLQVVLERHGFDVVENALDPYYVAEGVRKVFHDALYFCCLLVMRLFGYNLYDTIWMAARIA